jgi:protein-S-isoprenylcysteine O-methyltransferase Ste14
MYTAVLAAGRVCTVATPCAGSVLAWLSLAAVLQVKAGVEQRWMAEQHPGDAAYRARTRRFVPRLC